MKRSLGFCLLLCSALIGLGRFGSEQCRSDLCVCLFSSDKNKRKSLMYQKFIKEVEDSITQ